MKNIYQFVNSKCYKVLKVAVPLLNLFVIICIFITIISIIPPERREYVITILFLAIANIISILSSLTSWAVDRKGKADRLIYDENFSLMEQYYNAKSKEKN